MYKLRHLVVAAVIGAAMAVFVTVRAQQTGIAGASLTALDYIEIQNLVAKYPYALDSGADNGYAYADLFAPDGSFGRAQGREAIALMGRDHFKEQGPNYARHFQANAIIEPTPGGGATGKQYIANIYFGEDGKPTVVGTGGHYEDVYVKTPNGWRFKSRKYIGSKPGPAAAAPATAGPAASPAATARTAH